MGRSGTFQRRPMEAASSARPVFSVPSRPFVVTPPGPEEIAASGPAGGEGIRAPEPRREAPALKLPPVLPPAPAEMADLEGREIKRTELGSEPAAGMRILGLPAELRVRMEQSFRTNFSNVAVHRESAHAEQLGALAYTRGNQVYFAPGQFHPETTAGQELIGHELAHVVQQRQGRVLPTLQLQPNVWINHSPQLEREATTMGFRAVRGEPAMSTAVPSGGAAATGNVVQGAFTASALLESKDEAEYDRQKVKISNLNMSKRKRPPTRLGDRQGSHVVAWEAKVRDWSQLFVGPCDQVVGNLWAATQHDDKYDENQESRSERKKFLDDLKVLAGSTLPLSGWTRFVSQAITEYIKIYQKSSFTVYGEFSKKTPKGHGESSALQTLGVWNQVAGSGPLLISDEDVFQVAAKLLDLRFSLPENTKVKGIRDWIDTLGRLFPHLFTKGLLQKPLDQDVVSVTQNYSLANLGVLVKGSGSKSTGTTSTSSDLDPKSGSDASSLEDEALKNEPFLATIQADLSSGNAQTFKVDQIMVKGVALSDERPTTQFKAGQGSHTIAWSLERLAWSRLFGDGQPLTGVLKNLEDVLTEDQEWAAEAKAEDKAASERGILKGEVKVARNPGPELSLSQWTLQLNGWIERYVTIYQNSPFATFSEMNLKTGSSVPTGHGEGKHLANLRAWEADPSLKPDPADVARSALALLDVPAWQTNRERVGLKSLAKRWWDDFRRAFPSVATRYEVPISDALKMAITSPTKPGVDTKAPRTLRPMPVTKQISKTKIEPKKQGKDLLNKGKKKLNQ